MRRKTLRSSRKSKKSIQLAERFAGKHVVLTGTTGFVGKVFMAWLLDRLPEIGRVTIIVRAGSFASGHARFEYLADCSPVFRPLRERYGDGWGEFLAERVEVLTGDIAEPLCGLDEATAARVLSTVDAVVNFAGVTDFHPDPLKAFPANVSGAMHAADLAARTTSGRLLHVSTCFVAGDVSGDVPEELDAHRAPNGTLLDPAAEVAALDGRAPAPRDADLARRLQPRRVLVGGVRAGLARRHRGPRQRPARRAPALVRAGGR